MSASLCLLAATAFQPLAAAPPGPNDAGRITISAQSVVEVPADLAAVSVSVKTTDPRSLVAAMRENNALAGGVTAVLKASGLAEENYRINAFNLGPTHDRYGRIDGYEAARSWTVRVPAKQFETLPQFLTDLLEAGATDVGLNFELADQRAAQVEARKLAVEYARVKASHLAELNGLRLGRAREISESVEHNWDVQGGGFGGGFGVDARPAPPADGPALAGAPSPAGRIAARPVALRRQDDSVAAPEPNEPAGNADAPAAPATPFTPGLIRLNATVHIVWETLPR